MTIEMPGHEPEVIPHAERPEQIALVLHEKDTLANLATVIAKRKELEQLEEVLKKKLTDRFQQFGVEKIKTESGTFTLTAGRSSKVWQSDYIQSLEDTLATAKEKAVEGVEYTVKAGTPSILFTPSK